MELREVYEGNLRLIESGGVKKQGVLGVVEGVFFVAGKPSRNGRIYPYELWENVLRSSDLRRLLENRLMLGTVGHEDVDYDALIREQKVSHVVTDLKIMSDGSGVGRAEILDTPVGRILYSLMKSGSKLAVSSKAYGEYRGQTAEGYFEVDPQQFVLERFDFVVDPGFLEAMPRLKEEFTRVINKSEVKEVKEKMSESLELVIKEKVVLQNQLKEALDRVQELEKELQKVKNEKMNESGDSFKKFVAGKLSVDESVVEKELEAVVEGLNRIGETLMKYGVSEEKLKGKSVSEVIEKFIKGITAVKLKTVVESSKKVREAVEEEVEGVGTKLELYRKRIMRLKEELEGKKKLLYRARCELAKYRKMGSPEMVEKALRVALKFCVNEGNKQFDELVRRLSVKYGVSVDEARDVVKKFGKRAEKVLERLAERKEVMEKKVEVKKVESTALNETLIDRGFRIFGGKE